MNRESSIHLLNRALADELQAIHQYLYFHFHLDDQGLRPLAKIFRQFAVQEMGHVEKLADRILFLKGEVEMTSAGPVEKITDPTAMLERAAQMEEQSATDYNRAVLECAANADAASKQIFESLVRDEESHFNTFEQQRENIQRFGPSYLALQSFESLEEKAEG
jgi:bacterioferritin